MTATRDDVMDAVMQDVYGGPEVLRVERRAVPSPAADQVLIRVKAASVSQGDRHLMTGTPRLVRYLGFGVRGPKVRTRGMDVAGVVESVGAAITDLAVGDEVFGVGEGTFAHYALAKREALALKPGSVPFAFAAAAPVSGSAALLGLRAAGAVVAGERVLVTGAGGGVGSFAVQIAKAMGAHVTAVCSARKIAAVSTLGADTVIDYGSQDFTRLGETWDLILDTGGHRALPDLRRALTPRGRLVIVGSEIDAPLLGGFDRTLRAGMLSPFVSQKLVGLTSKETSTELTELAELMKAGTVRPLIGRTLSLAQVGEAMTLLKSGAVAGKIVIEIG